MNKKITNVSGAYFGAYSSSGKSSSDKSFSLVLDSNNQPIRGLWRRRKIFYARINITDLAGKRTQQRLPLKAQTLIQAQAELEKLKQNGTVPPRFHHQIRRQGIFGLLCLIECGSLTCRIV